MFHHNGTPQIISRISRTSVLYRSWPKLSQVDNVLDKEHRGLKALIPTIRVFRMIWWFGMVTTSTLLCTWQFRSVQIWESCWNGQIHAHSLVFYFLDGWDLDSLTNGLTLQPVSPLHPGHLLVTSSWCFMFDHFRRIPRWKLLEIQEY